jgi:putative endonuclease
MRMSGGRTVRQAREMRGAWVYFMTNRPNGTLYVGITNNLVRRVWGHREGLLQGFTRTHRLT